MRKIEFRGKVASEVLSGNCKQDGTWVYGFYRDRVGCPTISEFDFSYGNYIDFEIDRETLGQYTDKKDRNGTKIFEGDIVYYAREEEYCEIYWDGDDSRFAIRTLYSDLIYDFSSFYGEDFEVVGNIYDNPELLEGGAGND